ncbi:unnamed protein product [Adineta steineri]|uniref:Uncharacterized protein n=3 Tax=Adineta steineri TaxID=433720 RepID=A0A814CLE1_9BILA|nr:unnamed protein product [Adineta steineri]
MTTRTEITKQYGYLKFDENELDSTTYPAQYIRLALQTNPTAVVEFMQYGWRLPKPNLIISVVGGGNQCNMSAHLRKTFQRGLAVAAATTNAWLITTGAKVGVVKEVGEALNNYRYKSHKHVLDVPCIGICMWENINGNEQLDKLDVTDENHVYSYVVEHPQANRCELEPNHTHFLLFDGKSSDTNSLFLQRANIEKYARRINIESLNKDVPIPIVMILVDGGLFSARSICQALESNTPLVVVKGSGRVADLVADIYEFFFQEKTVKDETSQQKVVTEVVHSREDELNSIFERYRSNNNAWIDEMKHELCEVLYRRKQQIVIFEFNSERHRGNLEDAILEAVFNTTNFSGDHLDEQQCRVSQLKLAMSWQKFGYAQKHILNDTTISKWTEDNLCQALADGLERDSIDFLELLIEYGASLEKLTVNNLEQLYASCDIDNGLPLKNRSNEALATRNAYYSCYFLDQSHSNQITSDKNKPLGQNAVREFFLWAIFVDRFELAKYLCSKTWNQSVAPLIAAKIYRLASTIARHSESKARYKNNALQFEIYAKSIIDRCFDNDEYFALDLLKQPAVAFHNIVPLYLAEQTKCRAFLASKCVQKYLEQKWFGHINYKRQGIHFKIFLCALFLPLFPLFSVFLPYVHEHQQTIRNDKNALKNRRQIIIRTEKRFDLDDRISFPKRIIYFYRAPIVRFCYNVIFFVLFLGLFSVVILTDFWPLNIYYQHNSNGETPPWAVTEIVLHICAWSLIIEELRQVKGTDSYSHTAFILAVIFAAIANILLLNVLIALFNFTVQNVQEQSHDLWRYQRFLLVNEFHKKTPLPPPFNIVYYVFTTIRFFVAHIKIRRHRHRLIPNETLLNDVKTAHNNIHQRFKIIDIMRWEASIAQDFWQDTFKHDKNDRMEVVLKKIEQKIDHLVSRVQDIYKLTPVNHQPDK